MNSPHQPDKFAAQLQQQIAALELENAALRSQLAALRSPIPKKLNSAVEVQNDTAVQAEVLAYRRREAHIREQEQAAQKRVAELSKANEVLQASLQKLAEEPELEKFLGHLLTVCTERFAAAEAGLWRYEKGIFRLLVSYEDKTIKLRSEASHPGSDLEVAKKFAIEIF